MNAISLAMVLLLSLCWADRAESAVACRIEGPAHLMPDKVKQIKIGMSKAELEKILGRADYSPLEGQFYFSTGGNCPVDGGKRHVPCGVVAEFRAGRELKLKDGLQSCSWGAIGE